MLIGHVGEHQLRIVQAVLGRAPAEDVPAWAFELKPGTSCRHLYEFVRESKLNPYSETYTRLHAVAASLFVTSALAVLGPGGALHNPEAPSATRDEWSEQALRIQEMYVAELASMSISYRTCARLEAAVVERAAPSAFVLELVDGPDGEEHALVSLDASGYALLHII